MTYSAPRPDDIRIVAPPVSDDQISRDLRWLTERLHHLGADISGGFLGGEFGYGAHYDNDTFTMHPFCWCEQPACPWCLGCDCDVEDRGEHLEWDKRWVTTRECENCKTEAETAPNFLHKPTGSEVRWYKYIGRGMDVRLKGDWRTVLHSCAESIVGRA